MNNKNSRNGSNVDTYYCYRRYKVKRIRCNTVPSAKRGDTFERDLAMLNYFQEEFVYRNQHYWDLLVKSFVLTVAISIIPIASQVLGVSINNVPKSVLWFFPALGLVCALLSFFILMKEARKLRSVNEAKYRINRQCMSRKYHYGYYNDNVGQNSNESGGGKWLSYKMPFFILLIEFMIIMGVYAILHIATMV